ncbi:hypothetical protein E2562_022971 [Oryza meyeriana var. granulata]|uniref:Uncharacterized protein n=1 Tax=Oryza meyeriana var. granulata TaxID=110450 RepID=A0A6G1D6Y1_9ORYZ|nr:hypothetical protein E2562_022971 [Oryza meyeriana var. granulata]
MTSSPLDSPASAMARWAPIGLLRAYVSSSPRGGIQIDPATHVEGFFPDNNDAAADACCFLSRRSLS